jgi:pimeloyl-ACP methyl ester carboxylesterase
MRQADIDEYADALRDINDLVKRFQAWQSVDMGAQYVPKEVSENDKKAQKSPSWNLLFDSCAVTMNAGWDWVADDYSSYLKPWGFHPRDVKVPVVIWQGGLDLNVPPVHGKWLAKNIPNATLKLIEDESHVGLYVNYENETMHDAIALLNNRPIGKE